MTRCSLRQNQCSHFLSSVPLGPSADNENNQPRSPPALVEEKWKPQPQRNNSNNSMCTMGEPPEQEEMGQLVSGVPPPNSIMPYPKESSFSWMGLFVASQTRLPGSLLLYVGQRGPQQAEGTDRRPVSLSKSKGSTRPPLYAKDFLLCSWLRSLERETKRPQLLPGLRADVSL